MLKLCNVDIDRSQEIFETIAKYQDKVIQKLKPKKIIMFGSFARGDFNEGSDVDLIVIGDWQQDFLDRIKVLLDMNEFGLPLEPIGYTEQEFEQMADEGIDLSVKLSPQERLFTAARKTGTESILRQMSKLLNQSVNISSDRNSGYVSKYGLDQGPKQTIGSVMLTSLKNPPLQCLSSSI